MLLCNSQFTTNLAKVATEHGVFSEEISTITSRHGQLVQQFLTRKQGWTTITKDEALADSIIQFAAGISKKYSDIVILGIGGSMLGPKTILEAFSTHTFGVKVHYLDNIDPHIITKTMSNLNLFKTLILVQTKSGQTPETISQYLYCKQLLHTAKLPQSQHFVFITDPEKGFLRQEAHKLSIPSFPIHPKVGGRFSVLTPVGLVIAAIVGLDIKQMLRGANTMAESILSGKNTQALELAAIQLELSKKGKPMNVIMPYSSRLGMLANWYVQLLSESIGKKHNLNSQIVHTGLTPIPAVGATDQHSQMQLFKEGPNDKLLIFIEVTNHQANNETILADIPDLFDNNEVPQQISYLKNTTFSQLLQAEFKATRQSLFESLRPSVTITLDKINENSLGELFMFFQFATAFLGELLNINTYDQPGVERGKVLTEDYLLKMEL